jgi:predicted DNA-binding transcriptional regulator AlpA
MPKVTALTIKQFCDRNQISGAHYFNLAARGEGPRVMRLGKAVRITEESERDWQREREREHSKRDP